MHLTSLLIKHGDDTCIRAEQGEGRWLGSARLRCSCSFFAGLRRAAQVMRATYGWVNLQLVHSPLQRTGSSGVCRPGSTSHQCGSLEEIQACMHACVALIIAFMVLRKLSMAPAYGHQDCHLRWHAALMSASSSMQLKMSLVKVLHRRLCIHQLSSKATVPSWTACKGLFAAPQ